MIEFREIQDQRIGQVLVILALFANEESLAAGFIDEQAIPRYGRESDVTLVGKGDRYLGLPIARLDPLAGQRLAPALAEVAGAVPSKLRSDGPESCERLALPVSHDARASLCANAIPLVRARRHKDRKHDGGEGGNESVRHFRLVALRIRVALNRLLIELRLNYLRWAFTEPFSRKRNSAGNFFPMREAYGDGSYVVTRNEFFTVEFR